MDELLPDYVDDVLKEWETIACLAYGEYERIGRGVVGVSQQEDATELLYVEREFFVRHGNDRVIGLIDGYDPAKEFLVFFDTGPDESRTMRVRTPELQNHPRWVWFAEMVRRARQEPESLPEELPAWFRESLEELEQARDSDGSEN